MRLKTYFYFPSLLLAFTLSLFTWTNGFSQAQEDYYSGRIFVKIKTGSGVEWPQLINGNHFPFENFSELNTLALQYGIHHLKKPFRTQDPRLQNIYEIRFSIHEGTDRLISEIETLPYVEFAERVPIYRMDLTPNDMSFLLWSLNRVDATEAWDISTGSSEIVIAIVDNAVRYTHEDLAGNVWLNQDEIPNNNIDDDNNGFIDDINGWDAADEDNDPAPPAGSGFDHGSHVAGIASAVTNNGTGIAAIGFNSSLMCIKTKLDTTTGPELDNTYGGIDYAISAGADVVNMSFGGGGFSSVFSALFTVGHDSGIVFVASAGNDGQFIQKFPAGYAYVISVGSTDIDDSKSGFSNWHPTVDVMAPGNGIYSCLGGADDDYGFMGGTSMSAPLTSGLCALILSVNDTLNPEQVQACLEAGCENIDALNPDYAGYLGAGRINAKNSLLCAQNPSTGISNQGFIHPALNEPFPNPANAVAELSGTFPPGVQLSLRILNLQGTVLENLFSGSANGSEFKFIWDCSHFPPGIYLAEWRAGDFSKTQRICIIN